jgi:hypothetical protein
MDSFIGISRQASKSGKRDIVVQDENVIVNMRTGDVKVVDFGAVDFLHKAQKNEFQGEFQPHFALIFRNAFILSSGMVQTALIPTLGSKLMGPGNFTLHSHQWLYALSQRTASLFRTALVS